MGRRIAWWRRMREELKMPSRQLQLVLLAVVMTHSLTTAVDLGEEDTLHTLDEYAGPDGYAASAVIPKKQVLLKFVRGTKASCKSLCDQNKNCKGFKYGSGGCSLMGAQTKEMIQKERAKKAAQKAKEAKIKAKERKTKKPKKKKKVVTEAQRAKAEAFLKNVAGPQFDPKEYGKRKNMLKVMKAADEHESGKYKLKPAPRRTKKVVKRATKRLLRVRKKEMKARVNEVPKEKTMKKIRNKIENLPASTPAGSQQHIANQYMRHLRRQFARRNRKKVKKEMAKDKKKMPKLLKKLA